MTTNTAILIQERGENRHVMTGPVTQFTRFPANRLPLIFSFNNPQRVISTQPPRLPLFCRLGKKGLYNAFKASRRRRPSSKSRPTRPPRAPGPGQRSCQRGIDPLTPSDLINPNAPRTTHLECRVQRRDPIWRRLRGVRTPPRLFSPLFSLLSTFSFRDNARITDDNAGR